jgi:L-lactate dehydrogenase complex protein LldG
MLSRIRASLEVTGAQMAAQAAEYPPPHPRGPFVASELGLIEQFDAELSALHAHVHVCDGAGAALELVCELVERAQARQVLSWGLDQLPLPDLLPTLAAMGVASVDRQVLGADRSAQYAALEPITVGITAVDAAISESGTMLLVSGPERGRLASLLPPLHIALLPAERLSRTLPDAFARLREELGPELFRDRSNLTLITGPSRTADIELSLTLGVHGPRELHAIIIQ